MRNRDVRIGMHIEHATSGEYLGVVTEKGHATVRFDGSRVRDGHPVGVAAYAEIRLARKVIGHE